MELLDCAVDDYCPSGNMDDETIAIITDAGEWCDWYEKFMREYHSD
jgi:hypothetical protein